MNDDKNIAGYRATIEAIGINKGGAIAHAIRAIAILAENPQANENTSCATGGTSGNATAKIETITISDHLTPLDGRLVSLQIVMKNDDINEIMECARALRASLSVPVMLDHNEALKLIVADLTAKYHHNAERGDAEWTPIFEKVLSYYLSSAELAAITQANARAMTPAKDQSNEK